MIRSNIFREALNKLGYKDSGGFIVDIPGYEQPMKMIMIKEQHWDERFDLLDDFAMGYETAVTPMFSDDYLQEFYHFYRVRNRKSKLVPSEDGFHETLKDVSGDDCWRPIAEKTELLFGLPARVTVFEDDEELREEMGGRRGYAPFFFVFGIMFCEYEKFTLCFISGTNN